MIEVVTEPTAEHVEAMASLIPQLSTSSPPPRSSVNAFRRAGESPSRNMASYVKRNTAPLSMPPENATPIGSARPSWSMRASHLATSHASAPI